MLVLPVLLVALATPPAVDTPAAPAAQVPPAPSPAEMARDKAEEAERLYQERNLAAALARLREAFALFPSPKIHYNLGLVERALLREVEAIASFERFLAEAADADPERRADATRQIAELSANVVSLRLECDTAGAEVFVDGRLVGTTPLATNVRLAPGPHQLVVQKEGTRFPFIHRIEAAAGSTVEVKVALRSVPTSSMPESPALAVASAPSREAPPRSIYRSGWFWGGVGAAASVVGLSAWLLTRPGEPAPLCGDRCLLGELAIDGR